jgi:hypothetical protein
VEQGGEAEEDGGEQRHNEITEGEGEEEPVETVLDLEKHDEGDDVPEKTDEADSGDVGFAKALDRQNGRVIREILTDIF